MELIRHFLNLFRRKKHCRRDVRVDVQLSDGTWTDITEYCKFSPDGIDITIRGPMEVKADADLPVIQVTGSWN